MNCREAQSQLFAERDGSLDLLRRAALDSHIANCGGCQRVREDLTAALAAWHNEVNRAMIPNAELEWHAVRRRIRGGPDTGAARVSRPRRNLFAWIAVPLGTAAAVAVALFVSPQTSSTSTQVAHIARANSVEVPGNNATTMVFVDEKSGWLFVWASDATAQKG